MKKGMIGVLGGFVMLLGACTSPISLDLESGAPQMVVEAEMSNLLESYKVTLSFTTDFRGISDRSSVRNAEVQIIEEQTGERVELVELFPGEYFSVGNEFQGEVGNSYYLSIVLQNGKTYESDIVTIPEPVPIVSSASFLDEQRFLNEDLVPMVRYFQDLFVELDNTSDDHYVIFDNRGFIESFISYPECGGGFNRDRPPTGPAGPTRCWAFRDPIITDVVLSTNQNRGGSSYEVLALSIPFRFRGEYVVEIEAKAMGVESFNFWQQTKEQLERGDGIFDPPFAPIVGNMRNVDDPTEVVLGYFNAYGKSSSQLCFDWPAIGVFNFPLVPCTTLCTQRHAPAVFELPIAEQLCN